MVSLPDRQIRPLHPHQPGAEIPSLAFGNPIRYHASISASRALPLVFPLAIPYFSAETGRYGGGDQYG